MTLTNNLATALNITSFGITGLDQHDFASPTNTCGTTLAAHAHCTINVTFTPKVTGARKATLDASDSANNTPQKVLLEGTGQ